MASGTHAKDAEKDSEMFKRLVSFRATYLDGLFWSAVRKVGKLLLRVERSSYIPPVPTILIEATISQDGGSNHRTYHLNERVADQHYFNAYARDGHLETIGGDLAPEAVNRLYHALKAIKGVEEVSLSDYEVHLKIGRAFQWQHVEPAVLDLLKQHAGWFGKVKTQHTVRDYRNLASNISKELDYMYS